MTSIMIANVVLAIVNAILALVLGAIYWRNYRDIRSKFTLSLLLFALFLVVHNIVILYHFLAMMTKFAAVDETLVLVESVLQTVALGFLTYATTR